MNVKNSQRTFVGVTLLTVVSIAFVLVVYAAILGYIPGGEVFIGSTTAVSGAITYSLDNNPIGTWEPSLSLTNPATQWYAKLTTNTPGYSGPVSISWRLEQKTGTSPDTWAIVATLSTPTNVTLNGAVQQTIYTAGFSETGNNDWSTQVAGQAATYRVYVTVSTNP